MPNGALRAPPVAASLLLIRPPKIYKIYRIWVACVKGFFLSTLPPRPESIQSARPSIQSSELGPPTPSPARECCTPFGAKGGDTLTFGGGRGNQFRRWGIPTLWYSMYTIHVLQYNSNPSATGAVKYNFPRPLPLTSQLR